MDFPKDFDEMPYKRFINNVRAHGIGGDLWVWAEDWLIHRKQKIRINGSFLGLAIVTGAETQQLTTYVND